MNIATYPDSVLRLRARRHEAHARPAAAHRDGRAHPPPACLRAGGEADRGGVRAARSNSSSPSARPPARPRTRWCWRPTSSACPPWWRCRTTRTRTANRRPRCSGPSGAPTRRPATASDSIARSGTPGVPLEVDGHGARRAGPAGGGRHGRRVAGLAGRPLREPGPGAGRHEPARPLQRPMRRAAFTSAACGRPATRCRPTAPAACCCGPTTPSRTGPRTCTSW